MADINLDQLLAQRAEARGDDGTTFTFDFAGKTWTVKDPTMLTDDEKDELAPLTADVDVAAWYMGDEQYDRFVEAGGTSSLFFIAFREYAKEQRAEVEGRPTRPNRSSRRAAARKSSKQR